MKTINWYPAEKGDKRIRSWFALFPVTIGNETRWLENVSVEYEYRFYGGGLSPTMKWQKNRFV